MENKYVKVYLGSALLVNRLAFLLDEERIASIVKNTKESARLAGFGTTGDAVELHILNQDLEKAKPIIENFKKEITK